MMISAAERFSETDGAKGYTAEEYTVRDVYIWLCAEQAYNCHLLVKAIK